MAGKSKTITSGQFPTNGKKGAVAEFHYEAPTEGTSVSKKGNAKGGSAYPTGSTNSRSGKLNPGGRGPGGIKQRISYGSTDMATQTGRMTKRVPSAFKFEGR